jgi:rod shape-determining protein MreB
MISASGHDFAKNLSSIRQDLACQQNILLESERRTCCGTPFAAKFSPQKRPVVFRGEQKMKYAGFITEIQHEVFSIRHSLRAHLVRELAIDLGSANTRVFRPGHGIIINEPSMIAVDERNGQVVAVGRAAKLLVGRVPQHIRVVHPIRNGVVTDVVAASKMLSLFLQRAGATRPLFGSHFIMCVPVEMTPLEERSIEEVARRVGARRVKFIEEPLAAAAGAGIQTEAVHGSVLVDLGAETVNVAVLSAGGLVSASTWHTGGSAMDRAVARHLREKHNLEVSDEVAETIKRTLGSAMPGQTGKTFEADGRGLITRLPTRVVVTDAEIQTALAPVVAEILRVVAASFEELPPEVSADLFDSGIALTGGAAQLSGWPERLSHEIKLEVHLSNTPALAAVLGAARLHWAEASVVGPKAANKHGATGATASPRHV